MAATAPGRVLAEVDLSDMSKGMYRAGNREDAPPGSAFDITNGLIQDDGRAFRRAGSAYKSNALSPAQYVMYVWDGAFNAGSRTVFGTRSSIELAVLDADDATALVPAAGTFVGIHTPSQPVKVGDYLVLPGGTKLGMYAGSRKTAQYSTGTVAINAGSRVLTGTGTSWTANVDAGMIFRSPAGSGKFYVVQSVDSNTQITLEKVFAETSISGLGYTLNPIEAATPTNVLVPVSSPKVASIATRVAYSSGNQVGLSDINDPFTYTTGSYLRFPGRVIGLTNIRETLMVFTTAGMYAVGGLANATPSDPAGNALWSYQLANAELICWAHEGIAAYGGRAIVPCLDGIWMVDPISGPQKISDSIRDLYLSYVRASSAPFPAAGVVVGGAAVHANHYFLPILNWSGSVFTWVDTLVCRLDRGFAWTRLAGAGAQANAFASRRTSSPVLLGADSAPTSRVLSLAYFQPSTALKNDHDGTAHVLDITTRDIQGPGDQQNLFDRIRAWWTGTVDSGSPTVGATAQRPQDGSATTLQGSSGATYTAVSDGSTYSWWQVGKMGKQIRFRITTSGSLSTFVLNKLIALILPSGGE